MESTKWIQAGEKMWIGQFGKREYNVLQITKRANNNTYGVNVQYVDIDDYTTEELTSIIKEFDYEENSLGHIDDYVLASLVVESTEDNIEFTGNYEECLEWIQHWILKFDK